MILVSIITVNFNNFNGLAQTLTSVKNQIYRNFEHIIIDGGSTDESKKLIETNSTDFSFWVSEPDEGIYDAMNKGIAKAKGDYILFLNSGDELSCNNALLGMSKYLGTSDFVYSNIRVKDGLHEFIKRCPETLSFKYLYDDVPPHQATFIRRSLFSKHGSYDTSLEIVSDWKFFILAICKYNATYLYIDTIFSNFYVGGISSNAESMVKMNAERQTVLENEFSIFLEDIKYIFILERILRNLKKSRRINFLQKLKFLKKF